MNFIRFSALRLHNHLPEQIFAGTKTHRAPMSDRTILYLTIALLLVIVFTAMLISETTESPIAPAKVPHDPIAAPH